MPATFHDIAQLRRWAVCLCNVLQPASIESECLHDSFFAFQIDLPFWESQIRCLFIRFDVTRLSCSIHFEAMIRGVRTGVVRNVTQQYCVAVSVFSLSSAFMFAFHPSVNRIQLHSNKWWLQTIDLIISHHRPNAHTLRIQNVNKKIRQQFALFAFRSANKTKYEMCSLCL